MRLRVGMEKYNSSMVTVESCVQEMWQSAVHTHTAPTNILSSGSPSEGPSQWKCQVCSDGGIIEVVSVPHVFRYLVAELAAMNIRVKVETT